MFCKYLQTTHGRRCKTCLPDRDLVGESAEEEDDEEDPDLRESRPNGSGHVIFEAVQPLLLLTGTPF